MILVVADTGPIIHLGEIDALELLSSKSTAVDLMRALQTEASRFITDTVVERGITLLEESS